MGFGDSAKRKSGRQPIGDRAMTAAERMRAMKERGSDLTIATCADPVRRDSCRNDFQKWVYTYKPRSMPYSADHLRVMERMQSAVLRGGLYVLACWRSFGKTMLSEDCAEWATLYGHKRFVLLIGATEQAAQDMAASIRTDLEENELLAADFPEVCAPFQAMEGRPQRAASQTFNGEFLHAAGRSNCIQYATIKGDAERPAARGQIIKTLGLTGRLRGLKHKTPDGREIRPDLAIPDDPQTDESAHSPEQCSSRERLLTRAVAASGGPGSVLSVIMPCTVIATGDLSSRFLDGKKHPEYMRELCGLVVKWPDAQETLWKRYAELKAQGIDEGDPRGERATEFYALNRAAMDAGAVLSWPDWIETGELSGVQHVENMLIKFGADGFEAECQNAPRKEGNADMPYTLTEDIIVSRVDNTIPPRTIPDWSQTIIAATDVNPSYALSTAVVCFGGNQRAHVAWYGLYTSAPLPCEKADSPAVIDRAIQTALAAHGAELRALWCAPRVWVIDGAGTPKDTVINFSANSLKSCGLQAMCMFGRGSKEYRPYVSRTQKIMPFENGHVVHESYARRWIIWNADVWREAAQKAWTSAPTLPGSCSLGPGRHGEFAAQICSEILNWKMDTPTGVRYDWTARPGVPHDFGDCMAMAYAAAAWGGIGTGGAVSRPVRQIDRPRTGTPSRVCSVELEE